MLSRLLSGRSVGAAAGCAAYPFLRAVTGVGDASGRVRISVYFDKLMYVEHMMSDDHRQSRGAHHRVGDKQCGYWFPAAARQAGRTRQPLRDKGWGRISEVCQRLRGSTGYGASVDCEGDGAPEAGHMPGMCWGNSALPASQRGADSNFQRRKLADGPRLRSPASPGLRTQNRVRLPPAAPLPAGSGKAHAAASGRMIMQLVARGQRREQPHPHRYNQQRADAAEDHGAHRAQQRRGNTGLELAQLV